ncbi:thermonuclease family protein [Fictibacillus sp. NRS-1165]|uniref:thermonuclease family protein n=1 Tax=Fictibacillus sp. NRS-1165 TaxID=3144463 RepID=UPI003D2411F0
MYTYKANVIRVIDGDTLVANVDLGFYIHLKELKFRLIGINAPEIHGVTRESGYQTKTRLEELVLNKEVIIKTAKTDAFGRWLADLWVDGVNVNALLVVEGLAVQFMQ